MSCLDYIKSLRLQKAADLLEQQELSITDAAMTAGFSSLSYFYREFKNAMERHHASLSIPFRNVSIRIVPLLQAVLFLHFDFPVD